MESRTPKAKDQLLDDELLAKLIANCDRHELRDPQAVLNWAHDILFNATLLELVRKGYVEVARFENGLPQFIRTEAGRIAVQLDRVTRQWLEEQGYE